ncbi:rod shape-determining protein RodA [Gammaproteobacteria bacterium]|nr:rod shape-determining protein RodA [Gammaproteobacteria bacterium]
MGYIGKDLGRRKSVWEYLHIDFPLFVAILILLGFGLMVLYSATDGNMAMMGRQITFIIVSLGAMLFMAQLEVRILKRWAPWMYLGGMALLVAVIFYGSIGGGARRWIDLPILPRFQPSEIMKVVLPLCVAGYFSKRAIPPRFKHIFWALVIIMLPTALIAIQPDLGTALLIAVSGLFVILLAGINWKLVFSFLGVAILSSPALWIFYMSDYQKQRVKTLFDPQSDPLGTGWNIIQSQTAIGSGGVFGKGWLNGVQSRLDFLPEGQTDFIVAVLAEEFGLLGMLFLLVLYIAIIGRGLYIAATAQDTYSRLLAGSIILTFFVYVFVNIGMVSGILPVVGVPLPMVSLGGTSILTLMVGFGILMSIHTHNKTLIP